MQLGGLQQTTLSDFPDRVAWVFTAGCNLRCPYCHNPELIDGEPTLQDDLPRFVGDIADRGLDVKLDTNGAHPATVRETIDTGAIDYVAMDLKATPEPYDELGGEQVADAVKRSARVVREYAPEFEFRTTCDPSVVEAGDFERLVALAGDGPLYVQPVETGAVLEPGRVDRSPDAPDAAIPNALGCCPDPVEFRVGSGETGRRH